MTATSNGGRTRRGVVDNETDGDADARRGVMPREKQRNLLFSDARPESVDGKSPRARHANTTQNQPPRTRAAAAPPPPSAPRMFRFSKGEQRTLQQRADRNVRTETERTETCETNIAS